MRKIKVGIIQQANVADMRINLMNLAKSIESCAAHGAQLVVLQELHNSLYFCQTENTQLFDLAEPIPGPSTGFYSELAAANNIVLVTSLFEKRAPGLYHNTAVVFERDGSIVIVTHNMQQAARVSDSTAFFYMGEMVEFGDTKKIFTNPDKVETQNYITGRFG